MPRRRTRSSFTHLDAFERGRIVGLREAGWSYRRIAAHIGHDATSVMRCWRRWVDEASHSRRPTSGRPRSTDARTDRRIVRAALADLTATCAVIRAQVDPNVSPCIVGNRLLAALLRSRIPLARLPLTPNHRRARLAWCNARVSWESEWHAVVFSDEVRFCLHASDGRVHVRRRTGERVLPDCVRPRRVGPTPGVMVWSAISYDARSPLVFVEGTLTSAGYVQHVVRPVLLPFLQRVGALFQQDNARPHTARATQLALRDVHQLPWPASSPNLSPIKHVWDVMGRRLPRAATPPTTLPVLRAVVQKAWNRVSQDTSPPVGWNASPHQGLSYCPRRVHAVLMWRFRSVVPPFAGRASRTGRCPGNHV
jgi:hypothetical protein